MFSNDISFDFNTVDFVFVFFDTDAIISSMFFPIENALCFKSKCESDSQPDPSEAVVPLLIVCDIPIIPKLAPLTIASDDPVLGKPVELVEIVG